MARGNQKDRLDDIRALRAQIKKDPEAYANPKKVACIVDKLIADAKKHEERK